jgi:hypothetical protein
VRAYRIHTEDESEVVEYVVLVDDSGDVVASDAPMISSRVGVPLLGKWGYVRRRFNPMHGDVITEVGLDDPVVRSLWPNGQ